MSSYLEGYGVGDERRSRFIRWLLLATVLTLVLGTAGYFALRNYPKRRALDQFVERLGKKEYKEAYALWGCTDASPCRDYSYERFLRDWGPGTPGDKLPTAPVVGRATCGGIFSVTGILRAYQVDGEIVSLWVNSEDGNIGFAPAIGRLQCTVLP
jgi:hypothetical protein